MRLLGLDKVYNYIRDCDKYLPDEKANINELISDITLKTQDNLKMLAQSYFDKDELVNEKFVQGGAVTVFNAIKHGYKVVYSTELGKQLWQLQDENLFLMHKVTEIEETGQKIIELGGFPSIDMKLIDHIMRNIRFYSDQILYICQTKLLSDINPIYMIRKLRLMITKTKMDEGKKVGPNELCLCGSAIKYKKCCKAFEILYSDEAVLSLIGI